MPPILMRLAGLTLLGAALSTTAQADSLASSASSAGSASLGSLSNSLTGSSNSSSPTPVAAGDYRVIEVAEVAERPGLLRLRLQAAQVQGGDGAIWLTLPQQALGQRALAVGDIVSARHRPYGLEFARAAATGQQHEAFFLVLADDWISELAPRALQL